MSTYYSTRVSMEYYKHVRRLLEASPGDSLIDIGCADTPVATWGDFEERFALNRDFLPELPGVTGIHADFMAHPLDGPYDTVTCLQVLERIPDPEPFAKKLLSITGRRLIVSVPWGWPEGACKHHCQDPVDDSKMLAWFGKEPVHKAVLVDSGMARAVWVFKGN